MGAEADERLTLKALKAFPNADALREAADDLALCEGMPTAQALRILSGQARAPYATSARKRLSVD